MSSERDFAFDDEMAYPDLLLPSWERQQTFLQEKVTGFYKLAPYNTCEEYYIPFKH